MNTNTTKGKATALKKEAMIAALEKATGVVTLAAKEVGISRTQHYQWLKDDENYAELVEQIGNYTLDFAESKLHEQINAGNITAIIFYLKCKGKTRGYIEKQEVVNHHQGSVQVIQVPENGRN